MKYKAQPDDANAQFFMARISKTADSQPIVHAILFSCSGFRKTWRKFGIDANRSERMLNPSASNGLPVKAQNKIPRIAPPTQILFLESHLLSPNLMERIETAS